MHAPVVGVDRFIQDVEHGRFERALCGLAAIGAAVTGTEIWLEHDRASFGNRMMWLPVVATPVMSIAAAAGVWSKRMAKTALPLASALVVAYAALGAWESQMTDEPVPPDRPVDLRQPVDHDCDHGAHGAFDAHAKGVRDPSFIRSLPGAADNLLRAVRNVGKEALRSRRAAAAGRAER